MSSVPVALPRTLGRRLGSLPIAIGAALGFVVAYGLAHAWKLTFGYLLERLANIGIPTGIVGTIHPFRSLTAVDATVQNALYSVQRYGERGMVWGFTNFVELPLLLAGTALALSLAIFELGEWTYTLAARHVPHIVRETIVRPVEKVVTVTKARADARIGQLERTVTSLAARVRHIAAAIPADVVALPARVGTTPKQLRRISRRLNALEKATVGIGAVALVAAALGKLGMSWLRCPALLRMGRKLGCGGFSWLETFFADVFEALVILDLCRYALAAQKLARLVVPELGAVLLVQNAVCLGGGGRYPSAHDTTTVRTTIALPSAHD